MFDNTRIKYTAYVGGAFALIMIVSQLPPAFVDRFVPWLISSAVLVGGSLGWWRIKKTLDMRYRPAALGADAALHEKFINEFSNHLIASAYVFLTLLLVLMAGRTALYFFGKTTLGTAQEAAVLLAQETGEFTNKAATSIGNSVQYMVNGAANFDVEIDPESVDYRKEYSLLGGDTGGSAPTYATTDSNGVQAAPAPNAVQSAPVAEPQSAAPEVAPLASTTVTEYKVQPGDTLAAIAKRYGLPWEALCVANAATLQNCDNIRSNQSLVIPPAVTDPAVLAQVKEQAVAQMKTLVQSGQMVATGNQSSAVAVMSSVPSGWSTTNGIVTREDYNLAVQNSSRATLPEQPAQPASAVTSWTVIK